MVGGRANLRWESPIRKTEPTMPVADRLEAASHPPVLDQDDGIRLPTARSKLSFVQPFGYRALSPCRRTRVVHVVLAGLPGRRASHPQSTAQGQGN